MIVYGLTACYAWPRARGQQGRNEEAMSKLSMTYIDFNGDKGNCSFEGSDLAAVNFDAQRALQNTLRDATNAIVLTNLDRYAVEALSSPQQAEKPANAFAQREIKWLVRYHDVVTQNRQTVEIPGADLSKLIAGTELADMTDTDVAAFVSAFEAYVKTADGNAPSVDEIVYVSRR